MILFKADLPSRINRVQLNGYENSIVRYAIIFTHRDNIRFEFKGVHYDVNGHDIHLTFDIANYDKRVVPERREGIVTLFGSDADIAEFKRLSPAMVVGDNSLVRMTTKVMFVVKNCAKIPLGDLYSDQHGKFIVQTI